MLIKSRGRGLQGIRTKFDIDPIIISGEHSSRKVYPSSLNGFNSYVRNGICILYCGNKVLTADIICKLTK